MIRKNLRVDEAGVTAPTLVFTVNNELVSNRSAVAVLSKMEELYKAIRAESPNLPAVEFCVFGASFDLSSKGITRNSVALFDGICRREFSFLVRDDQYNYPITARWMANIPSLWGVVVQANSQKKRPNTILHCAQQALVVFVKRFEECDGEKSAALREIKAGHYPWGPRRTAVRRPRKPRDKSEIRESLGYF